MELARLLPFLIICLSAVAFASTDDGSNSEIKVPKEVDFLDIPAGLQLRVSNGMLEALGRSGYSALNLPASSQKVANSGKPIEFILGAPAIVTEYAEIDARRINNNNRVPTTAAFVNGRIAAFLESRVRAATGVETHFSVFVRDGDFRKISEFKLRDNLYNLYLEQAYPVSTKVIALVLRAARDPYVNALVFFDLSQERPVGYREFSQMQYIPERQAIWIAQEVPNCDNLTEALQDSEKRASVIPIFKDGKLNTEFSETADFEEVEAE